MLKVLAPAKINLVLEVLGKRKDNYHEISSIVTTVSLYDELFFEDAEQTTLVCDFPELNTSENLVIQAVNALKNATNCRKNVLIKLVKKIPLSTGLGGGSSDAAATLKTLNQLWRLNLTLDELARIAAKLGSDVPFFIYGDIALIRGRGEKVLKLNYSKKQWFTILVPNGPRLSYKTGHLYSLLKNQHFTTGKYVSRALKRLQNDERFDNPFLFNTFDNIKLEAFPWIDVYWNSLKTAVGSEVHLAGSGPALYTTGKHEHKIMEVFTKLQPRGYVIYTVTNCKKSR